MYQSEHIEKYKNLNDFISQSLIKNADKAAYSCLGLTQTFAQIDRMSLDFAAYLQSLGLVQGDRVAIQLPNLIQYPIVTYAILRAGFVVVNTNPFYTAREMHHQFVDSGAKAIIILKEMLPKLKTILSKTSINTVIVTDIADLITQDVDEETGGHISFNQALKLGGTLPFIDSTASLDDIALLQYTGGTTGVAKGACLTHKNIISNTQQIKEALGEVIVEGKETFICPLPLYHIYAFTVNMVLFATQGNLNVLIPNPRDIDSFVESMSACKFTGISGLNTLFVGLCANPRFKTLDFSDLKLTLSGGSALTEQAATTWKNVTDCAVAEGYGLTETSPVLCVNKIGNEMLGTVGKPLANTEIQFWDSNDNPVADGLEGQLVARGPQVMDGYWNMPEETVQVLSADGFFKTGDIGIRLPNGEIKIVDRLKDMIIVSGFNVYPNEIENIIAKHPDVIEVAVVGEPDERCGEKVCAYVTVKQPINTDEIKALCKEELTAYKVPNKICVIKELPKSTVGKILKRELREIIAGSRGRNDS